MYGIPIKILLAAALATSSLAAARPPIPFLQPLTEDSREAALAPLPGITFNLPPPPPPPSPQRSSSRNKRTTRERFKQTTNHVSLHRYHNHPGHLTITRRLRTPPHKPPQRGTTTPIPFANITPTNAFATQYGIPVTFGHQTLLLDLDTGSSDTWAFSATATNCTDSLGDVIPPRYCHFGPGYIGNLTYGAAGGQDEHVMHMRVRYGDGEAVEGALGRLDVTLGGVRVRNQTVGLARVAAWQGNGVSSGVLGLAYPGLTSGFAGPVGREEEGEDSSYSVQYSPVFSSMVSQGLVEDFFSVAVDRPGEGSVSSYAGRIGFGGVPEGVGGVDYDVVGEADIIIANVADNKNTAADYSFYTIIPDGWYYGSSTDDRKVPFIVDTGTTLIYLPTALAQSLNDMFSPPAVYSFMEGGYLTSCDAVAPRVAVVVGGTPFYLNPEDLVFRNMPDAVTGLCMTAFNDGAAGPFVLGDVFLKNVLAIFDVGENVLQLAGRMRY